MTLSGDELIEKSNAINEQIFRNTSLPALRFFSIYLAKINPRDEMTRVVRFKISDFEKIMEIKRLNKTKFFAETDKLLHLTVHMKARPGVEAENFNVFQSFRWINSDGERYIEANATDDAIPYLFNLRDRYFTYKLWNVLRLKSSNQIRMYEILKQYEHIGKREFSIEELKQQLYIDPQKYERWDVFKTKVLEVCKKALEETTDIKFTYERGKTGNGGKWLTIIFHIYKNEDYIDQLCLGEYIQIPEFETIEPEEQEYSEYSDSNIELLAEACNNEFTPTEMDLIFSIIAEKKLPESPNGVWIARYHYLTKKYAELEYRADRKADEGKPIKNRFAYFRAMLEGDTKNDNT